MALPTDIDATYPDRDSGDRLHQQHHDTVHGIMNDPAANWDAGNDAYLGRGGGFVYDVKAPAYGATGDGVVDDAAAIQAALDAASTAGGGLVFAPAGTYATTALLSVPAGVTFFGAGTGVTQAAAATVISPSSGTSGVTLAGDGAELAGMFLVGAVSGTSDGVVVAGSRPRVGEVTVSGFGRYGVSVDSTPVGVNCNLARLDSVRITGCGSHGLYITGGDSNAGLFTLVDVVSVTGYGIYSDSARNRFISCHLSNNTGGGIYDDSNSNYYAVYIEGGTGSTLDLGTGSSYGVYEALNYGAPVTITGGAAVRASWQIIQNAGYLRHVKIHDVAGSASGKTWEFRSGIVAAGGFDLVNNDARVLEIDANRVRAAFHCAVAPNADNGQDLGRTSQRWKNLYMAGVLSHAGTTAGFFGTTPTTRPSLTYSRTGETTAEAQLRAALSALGLVADNTTA